MINPPAGPKYSSLMYKNSTSESIELNYNWIKINLEGSNNEITNNGWSSKSNKSAIGARVLITHLDGSIQSREVIAGKGHGSMDALELHFGLGNFSEIQNIVVRWPSKDQLTNQQKVNIYDGPFLGNQMYRIVEDLGFVGNKGDGNFDEDVNILDVMFLINALLIDSDIDLFQQWALDLNYSDNLNVLDVTKLVYFILYH